jgi:ATP-dependent exoDNAse (exonuclease V) alpha subunit
MGIQLEGPQEDAVRMITDWFKKANKQPFVLAGLAGTGKTTIVKYFMDKLNLHPDDVAFVAYTGKAALVLTSMGTPARTIHKLIYKAVEDPKTKEVKFVKSDKLEKPLRLIVVDEASMVSEDIQTDLESFKVPIIYIGDHGQLPPVNGISKLMMNPDIKLENIHRQAEGNPIIFLAKMARLGAKLPYKEYGKGVIKMSMKDVTPSLLTSVDQILCGKNATRIKLNQRVRACMGKATAKVTVGDRVICLRNNWQQGYINGMTAVVKNIHEFDKSNVKDEDSWRFHVDQQAFDIDCDHETGDYSDDGSNMLFNIPFDGGVFSHQQSPDMKNRCIEPFDFAYAITVHKAQGSQYTSCMVIEEHLGDMSLHKKWLYTAITRAAQGLILVGK